MNLYDYSFNNNYLLFQNTPSSFSNFDYGTSNSSLYHEYNTVPIPSYNHFTNTPSSQIFSSSIRHSNINTLNDGISNTNHNISNHNNVKCQSSIKNDSSSTTNSDTLSLGKMQGLIHNTSEHVQELNQMCQIKEPKEFDKNLSSE